ncbi:MAG: DUF1592 domain-containing protein [Myxococcaceae bacterium]|nr:DUF1592 domain-containing protein [Myxococcaceae bacterium]
MFTRPLIGLLAATLVACTGEVISGKGRVGVDPNDPIDMPPTPEVNPCVDQTVQPGRSPLRRLTRFEYNNTIRDVLGDTTLPANSLEPEQRGNGFGNDADTIATSELLAQQYSAAAEGIAARATASAAQLERLDTCTRNVTANAEAACTRRIVERLGQKLWRRPLAGPEVDDLLALATAVRPTSTYPETLATVLEAMIQAPEFLYRPELGVTDLAHPNVKRLTGYELATRLSYMFWGSAPDDVLLAAARDGQLDTPAGVRAQAERLLDHSQSREMLRYFFDNFLPISSVGALTRSAFPMYNATVGAAMREETQRLIEYELFSGSKTWPGVLTAQYTFVNGPLAEFYGMTGITGSAFQKVNVDPTKRLGVMTQAAVQAGPCPSNPSSPVARGVFVLRNLLCHDLHAPAVDVGVIDLTSAPTARGRLEAHEKQPVCANCHKEIDAIGLAFENYDSVGLWRDQENGHTIDASGALPNPAPRGAPIQVDGPLSLARGLATHAEAQSCFATTWLSFSGGRSLKAADACAKRKAADAFKASGYDMRELLLSMTTADSFLYRPTE